VFGSKFIATVQLNAVCSECITELGNLDCGVFFTKYQILKEENKKLVKTVFPSEGLYHQCQNLWIIVL